MCIIASPVEQVAQVIGSGMCQCPAAQAERAHEQARRNATARPRISQDEAFRNLEQMRAGAEAAGSIGSYGLAQQLRAPGRTFTSAEVLAILRYERARSPAVTWQEIITTFERME